MRVSTTLIVVCVRLFALLDATKDQQRATPARDPSVGCSASGDPGAPRLIFIALTVVCVELLALLDTTRDKREVTYAIDSAVNSEARGDLETWMGAFKT
jgi:hypothetical protein